MTELGSEVLRAVGVTKRFGGLLANDRIDLTVAAGEVVGLLGANGAGKSTFMRVLLGLLRPDSGTVALFGRPPSRAVRRRVGYVPQGLGLYEDLTAAENLEFAARAFGVAAPPSLDPDLQGYRDTLVRDLPLGVRRRLAFAATLAHDPALLVLDEPTSGVEPLARGRLWDTVREAAQRGAGVLVSTHYMEEVEHCDRLVVLVAGRVLATGALAEIVGDRRAVAVRAPSWQDAFQALDRAGIAAALHGRELRLAPVDRELAAQVLQTAGVAAELADVPATFEEAFVALSGAA